MKREGRQHGMVRTYRILPLPYNPRPNARFVNRMDSPPTAGLFSKLPLRPTNHSKFTSKCSRVRCSGCHLHPACKSKEKTKGYNKCKSFDVSSPRMVTWRVIDSRPGLNLSGISASGLLDHLADYDYAYDDDYDGEFGNDGGGYDAYDDDKALISKGLMPVDEHENEGLNTADQNGYDDENDKMSFCDLGVVLDDIEEGNWCLVGEW